MHPISRLCKPVDQPVPVVGRLDGDPREVVLKRLERLQDRLQVVGKPLFEDPVLSLVDDGAIAVGCM
jgi:hypothetical protein